MKKLTFVVIGIVLITGCSTVYPVGNIGEHHIYHAVTRDLFAPCTSTIFVLGPDKQRLDKVDGGTGPSIIGQFLGPAAVATAGYFIGDGLGDSGDKTSITENTTLEGSRAGAVQGQIQGQSQRQGQVQNQSLF